MVSLIFGHSHLEISGQASLLHPGALARFLAAGP